MDWLTDWLINKKLHIPNWQRPHMQMTCLNVMNSPSDAGSVSRLSLRRQRRQTPCICTNTVLLCSTHVSKSQIQTKVCFYNAQTQTHKSMSNYFPPSGSADALCVEPRTDKWSLLCLPTSECTSAPKSKWIGVCSKIFSGHAST